MASFTSPTRSHRSSIQHGLLLQAVALLVLAGLLALPACTPKNKGYIEVGDTYVTKSLFEKRMAQMKLMFPEITEAQVASQLVEGLAAQAILTQNGMGLTREELDEERRQLQANEELRQLFLEVQRIYGASGQDLLDIGLLPDLAVRHLYTRYETGQISFGLRETAEQVLSETQHAPATFAEVAESHGATIERLTVNTDEAIFLNAEGERLNLAPQRNLRVQYTRNLAVAAQELEDEAVLGVITQTRRGYMLTKILGHDGHNVHIEAAFLERPEFKEWFVGAASDLKVCVHDDDMQQRFNVAARSIKLNCAG